MDIIEDHSLISSTDREIKQMLQATINRNEFDKLSKRNSIIILNKEPIIHHKQVTLLFSNTCYRLHPKSEKQKKFYLKFRKFSLLLYNYLLQRVNAIEAAMFTIEGLSEYIDTFDDIDYYIEFLFDPKLQNYQDRLLAYLLLSQTDPHQFENIQRKEGKFENIVSEVDLTGITFSRHKYLRNDSKYVKIRNQKLILDIPVKLLPQIPNPQIVQLGYRKVGTIDKSLTGEYIRNALHDLFPLMINQPRYLVRKDTTNNNLEADINIIQTAVSLEYQNGISKSIVSIYQIMNTYLPLRNKDVDLNIKTLTSQTHQVSVYNSQFQIKFNPNRLSDSFPEYGLDERVGIYDIPVNQIPVLYENLQIFSEHLPHVFVMPKLVLDYFTAEITSKTFQELFDYYNNWYGGDLDFLNISRIERNMLKKIGFNESIIFTMRQISDGIILRLTFKSRYIREHLPNLMNNLDRIDYMLKNNTLNSLYTIIDALDVDPNIINNLKSYIQDIQHITREEFK